MSDKKGVMCVVACPLLENELVYSMYNDPQRKRILLADTGSAVSIKRKMDAKGMEYELISEKEFFHRRDNLNTDEFNILILMNRLGLHAEPKELKAKVEDDILRIGDSCDCICLYYGLCGNALWDPVKWAEGKIDTPVFIFRGCNGEVCDDCVGVAVSGTENYRRLLKTHTGQLLVIPAMAENWEEFFCDKDMRRGAETMNMDPMDYMKLMFEICGYEFAVRLDTGLGDPELYEIKSKELADRVELKLIDAKGEFVNRYSTDRMYGDCKSALPDM